MWVVLCAVGFGAHQIVTRGMHPGKEHQVDVSLCLCGGGRVLRMFFILPATWPAFHSLPWHCLAVDPPSTTLKCRVLGKRVFFSANGQ